MAPRRSARLPLVSGVGYAAPFPGYPPYPLPYPMFPPPPAKTAQGIGNVRWSLVLGAAMQAVNIAGYIWTAVLLSQFPPPGSPDFGLIFTTLAFECAAGIIGFVAVLLFLLGIYYANDGREEYDPIHVREMEHALIFFIIALVMGLIGSVAGLGFSASPLTSVPGFNPVGGAFGIVRGVFVGLCLLTVVKTFTTKEDRTVAWIGTAILAAAPAIGAGISSFLYLTRNPADPLGDPASLPFAFLAAAGLAATELVGYGAFLWIYSKVLRRMRSGEFPPIPRPPMVYAPYYPGPAYYPWYPAYPASPEAPPPAPPPGQPPP